MTTSTLIPSSHKALGGTPGGRSGGPTHSTTTAHKHKCVTGSDSFHAGEKRTQTQTKVWRFASASWCVHGRGRCLPCTALFALSLQEVEAYLRAREVLPSTGPGAGGRGGRPRATAGHHGGGGIPVGIRPTNFARIAHGEMGDMRHLCGKPGGGGRAEMNPKCHCFVVR